MDLTFLSQADSAALKLEIAKRALESAKVDLETAKQAYDDILAQTESHGIPRAKLKKLTEDRVQILIESGILGSATRTEGISTAAESKRDRPKKGIRKPDIAPASVEASDATLEEPTPIEPEPVSSEAEI